MYGLSGHCKLFRVYFECGCCRGFTPRMMSLWLWLWLWLWWSLQCRYWSERPEDSENSTSCTKLKEWDGELDFIWNFDCWVQGIIPCSLKRQMYLQRAWLSKSDFLRSCGVKVLMAFVL